MMKYLNAILDNTYLFLVKVSVFVTGIFKDDKGNVSSLRVILVLAAIATWDMILWWRKIVMIEIQRPGERDLQGVALIGSTIIPVIITAVIAKILQKKLEK